MGGGCRVVDDGRMGAGRKSFDFYDPDELCLLTGS